MPKQSKPVTWSPDLERLVNLPTRDIDWQAAASAANAYSRALLNPKGLAVLQRLDLLAPDVRAEALAAFARDTCPIELTPEQVVVLSEWAQHKGVLVLGPVGVGKTLAAYLMCLLAERLWGTTRNVICVPSYLYDDTLSAHETYREYWQSHVNTPQIITYSQLSQEKNAFLLCDCAKCTKDELPADRPAPIRPQVLIFDEADLLRHTDAAVTSRVGRFLKAHLVETITCAMTGSLIQDSCQEALHLMTWTLKDRRPFALSYPEIKSWCSALDPSEGREGRADPEMLIQTLEGYDDGDSFSRARKAMGRRWARTPGFVVINKASCATAIHVRVFSAPDDPVIEDAFWQYRAEGYKSLDGWIIGDSLSRGAYERALGCGYYDYWDPRPPLEWLLARNAYNECVRDIIDQRRKRGKPIDTELQARRLLKDTPELAEWIRVQTEIGFKPNPVSASVSPSVVNWCKQWLQINDPGIIWVNGSWIGETLEKLTGVKYYAADGKAKDGTRPVPGQSIIASTKSNLRGRNWQAWNRMLVPSIPGSSSWQEQMIGRAHRQGQTGDIHVDYLVSSGVTLNAISAAFRRSQGTEDLFGLTPKILTSQWDWSTVDPRVLRAPEKPTNGFEARWRSNARLGEKDR